MSDKSFESISALMDNQADDLELRRLLKEMQTNDAIANKWSQFHLARDILHKESSFTRPIDLTARVRDALQAEIAHQQSFFNTLPKMAAVAAVAMLSVLITAKLVVNQSSTSGVPNNMIAVSPNVVNPSIQRAGYIVGQPGASLPSLRAQHRLQNNDIQRVDATSMPRGYIVLPAAEAPSNTEFVK